MELLLLVDQVDGPPAPRATSNTGASAAFAPGDEHTVDVRRRGWAGMEARVPPVVELGLTVGVVQIEDNI
ncbi:MAG: hypothetical protein JO212_06695, partial [Acetobacteraceae bacterium]|nr:hypothetical protein [Acetobacteraceae bacterium]